MRTETREVTIMQTYYISDDGLEFTDEDKCTDHEFKLLEKTFKCYDGNYVKCGPEDCKFIDLPTVEDVERYKQYCDVMDLIDEGLDKPGLYMFDETDYCHEFWVNLDDVISHIRGEAKEEATE